MIHLLSHPAVSSVNLQYTQSNVVCVFFVEGIRPLQLTILKTESNRKYSGIAMLTNYIPDHCI